MNQILFFSLTALTLLTAFFVVFTKNPMYSVLALIACFFTIAGHYIMLSAQFLAIVHLIVYAGAIMVLFLFVVMLLNLNAETEPQSSVKIKLAGTLAGGMLFLILIASMKSHDLGMNHLGHKSTIGYVEAVGLKLFNDYLLPFEISSVLFLSAMIGAVVLAKKDKA
ncbi:MAG: NADH-quinone oxidoreductase subunit J [Bacteroidota bacterium]|jgi:NADH-quinone oxidoreductase subunit J